MFGKKRKEIIRNTNFHPIALFFLAFSFVVSVSPGLAKKNRVFSPDIARTIAHKHILHGKAHLYNNDYYHSLQEFTRALEVCPEAVKGQPGLSDNFCEFGKMYLAEDRHKAALVIFKKAYFIDPENPRAKAGLAVTYGMLAESLEDKSVTRSVRYYRKALALLEGMDMDRAFIMLGMPKVKMDGFTHINLDLARSYCSLAKVYSRVKDYDRAEEYFKYALDIKPGLSDAVQGLAAVEYR